ncbi:MLO-like protein 6 [Nymphaea thermarum]|nr:MLO-like protein 6 [Nymphaea thermarum]
MAGGGKGGRSLEETPTWAVAVVCFLLVLVSILIEHSIHLVGQWLTKKHKRALCEALEKLKSGEFYLILLLMLNIYEKFCVLYSEEAVAYCTRNNLSSVKDHMILNSNAFSTAELMLLGFISLLLTVGQAPLSEICISERLGRTMLPCIKKKTSGNEEGGKGSGDGEGKVYNDEVVGRKLLWSEAPGVDFRRILAGGGGGKSAADLVKCNKPASLFHIRLGAFSCDVLHSHHGYRQSKGLFLQAVCEIILLVGTKLQVVITRMGLEIQGDGDVIKGIPVVRPADHLFWFNRPRLILYIIHFVLFQILCSYVTLPLYALVTQMGSNMKPTIFDERVADALRRWHNAARKHIKESRKLPPPSPGSATTPAATPGRGSTDPSPVSPLYLLRHGRSVWDSSRISSGVGKLERQADQSSASASNRSTNHGRHDEGPCSHHHPSHDEVEPIPTFRNEMELQKVEQSAAAEKFHEVDHDSKSEFSFEKSGTRTQIGSGGSS